METTSHQPSPVQTPASEPIQKFSGDTSPTSWDDLEKITLSKSQDRSNTERKSKETKTEKTEKQGKEKDHGQETDKESKEADQKDSEKVLSKTAESEKVEKSDTAVKLIKIRNGEQEVELRADAPVTVKVDGKTLTVPLQEVLNNYSGQASLTRKFQEYQTTEKKFNETRSRLQEGVRAIQELANAKDPRSAIYKLAEWSGKNGEELYKEFITNLEQKFSELQNLSPEERKLKEVQERLAWHEGKEKERSQKESERKIEEEFLGAVREVQKKTSLSDSDFADLFEEYQKVSGKKIEQIHPKEVGEYYEKLVLDNKIGGILKDVGCEEAQFEDAKEFLLKAARLHKDLSDEDLRAIALEGYGKETAKRLSRKVKKMDGSGAEKKTVKDPQKSPLFFDDLG